VIARATSLWGGVFNPIVILDGSTREVCGRQEPAKYGLYSNDDSYEFLRKNFGAEAIVYDAQFKASLKPRTFHTPLSLTAYGCSQTRQHVHSRAYFLLNPENPFDVVDYWNLRAAGMILFPLTLQDYKEFEQPIHDFGALAAYPINERITNHVVLVKARSISEEELATVADWIRSLGFLKDFSTMGWVPRYNMNGAANRCPGDYEVPGNAKFSGSFSGGAYRKNGRVGICSCGDPFPVVQELGVRQQ
jgi:hypothetical protein